MVIHLRGQSGFLIPWLRFPYPAFVRRIKRNGKIKCEVLSSSDFGFTTAFESGKN